MKILSFGGKCDTCNDGRVDMLMFMFCSIAEHETLPRRIRKACERNKEVTLVGFPLCLFSFQLGRSQ